MKNVSGKAAASRSRPGVIGCEGAPAIGEAATRQLFAAAYAGGFQLAMLVAGSVAVAAAGLLLATLARADEPRARQ